MQGTRFRSPPLLPLQGARVWSLVGDLKILHAMLCLVVFCNRMDCSLPGSSVHGDSPGKNTGEACHALLQGIFRTQGSNPGSPTLQMDSLLSEPLGKPCHAIQCGKIKKKKWATIKNRLFFFKEKATSYIQGNFHQTASWHFGRSLAGQKEVAQYSKWWQEKSYNQEYPTWQAYYSDLKER